MELKNPTGGPCPTQKVAKILRGQGGGHDASWRRSNLPSNTKPKETQESGEQNKKNKIRNQMPINITFQNGTCMPIEQAWRHRNIVPTSRVSKMINETNIRTHKVD